MRTVDANKRSEKKLPLHKTTSNEKRGKPMSAKYTCICSARIACAGMWCVRVLGVRHVGMCDEDKKLLRFVSSILPKLLRAEIYKSYCQKSKRAPSAHGEQGMIGGRNDGVQSKINRCMHGHPMSCSLLTLLPSVCKVIYNSKTTKYLIDDEMSANIRRIFFSANGQASNYGILECNERANKTARKWSTQVEIAADSER